MQRVDLREVDISSLKRIVYGGQSASRQFHERMEEVFAVGFGIELAHVWGITEGGTAGTFLRPAEHTEGLKRIGEHGLSVGREGFNDWVKVELRDDDDAECQPGETGEICLRGPSVMDRYVNDPQATDAALRRGWLHTGDLAVADDDGYLYFVDRKKHMIRRGGLNIASAEVESVLMEHPAIAEVAVIPTPNPILGEEVKAAVVLKPGQHVTADEIRTFAAEYLADYKVPKEVVFLDRLPRNAMGRVMKGLLKGEAGGLQA
jgi:acyl-CoA synthetase (AMP-forming)/AMP-acid ligase II